MGRRTGIIHQRYARSMAFSAVWHTQWQNRDPKAAAYYGNVTVECVARIVTGWRTPPNVGSSHNDPAEGRLGGPYFESWAGKTELATGDCDHYWARDPF